MLELCVYVLLAFIMIPESGAPVLARASTAGSTSTVGLRAARASRDILLWPSSKRTGLLPHESVWAYTRRRGSLPLKPALSSPASASWNNTIAMCTSVRAENTTDLREWVMYHRWLGFDHIFMTENAKTASKELQAQLRDFISAGFLTYSLEPTGASPEHCLQAFGQRKHAVAMLCQGCLTRPLSALSQKSQAWRVGCRYTYTNWRQTTESNMVLMDVQKRPK